MTRDRELKKGTLEMLLLRILSEGKAYGYDLVSQLTDRSGGTFGIKEGTLYPVLYRLQDRGLIEAEWSQPEERAQRGVPRKYYRLTESGATRLTELEESWRQFVAAVESVLESAATESGTRVERQKESS